MQAATHTPSTPGGDRAPVGSTPLRERVLRGQRWPERLRPRPRGVLILVLLWALFASLFVAIATPPWEANDEPDHVRNAQRLVGGHWYRIDDPVGGFEPHQAPLYYLILAGYQKWALGIPEQPAMGQLTNTGVVGPRNFAHDVAQDGADQRLVTMLRLVSVLLGVGTVALTALLARKLSEDPWTPVIAAAFVAGVPRFEFLSGVVNNDNLSNSLGAAVLVLAIVALGQRDATARRRLLLALALGAVGGALVLSKLTAVFLLPPAAVALFYGARRFADRLASLAVFGFGVLAVSGWWLIQNQVRYGDPLASKASHDHLAGLFPPLFSVGSWSHQAFDAVPKIVHHSFWYTSGGNQLYWAQGWLYTILWLALAAALAGLLRRGVRLGSPRGSLAVLWLAVLGGAAAIWTLGIQTTTTQARIGFFALPAVGALYALAVQRWRLPVPVRFALPVLCALLTLVAIRRDILQFYPG
jgi:hypothetical protein